jgi:hypothetical protein
MADSSLLFKGVPLPPNLKKILAACVVRDSSVENEAYLDNYRINLLIISMKQLILGEFSLHIMTHFIL